MSATSLASLWEQVTTAAKPYIPDWQVEMMLAMTRGNLRDTLLMILGFVIKRLDLLAQNDSAKRVEYREEMEYFRALLQICREYKPQS